MQSAKVYTHLRMSEWCNGPPDRREHSVMSAIGSTVELSWERRECGGPTTMVVEHRGEGGAGDLAATQ